MVCPPDLPREKAATELEEYAETEQIQPETPGKLYLDVCIGFRF